MIILRAPSSSNFDRFTATIYRYINVNSASDPYYVENIENAKHWNNSENLKSFIQMFAREAKQERWEICKIEYKIVSSVSAV